MKLIVGLGNPGKEYEKTRHNSGWMAIDKVADALELPFSKTKFNAMIAEGNIKDEKVILMKPLTFMNLSGSAVAEAVHFYKIDIKDVLILHDDLDLPVGKIRIRESGSAGGQKGMKHIIDLLGTQDVRRIRIGIGKDKIIPVVDWVLGKVPAEQWEEYESSLDQAAKAAKAFITMPFDRVMNRYNGGGKR